MVSIPQHRKLLFIAGAVTLLVLAAFLLVRCTQSGASDAPEVRSYRATSVWDNKDVGLPLGYHAASGTILLWQRHNENNAFSPHQVAAIDARTGKPKWMSGPAGWDVNVDYVRGNRLTADAIIVQSNYQKRAPAIAALRLSDGEVLWTVQLSGEFGRPTAVTAKAVVVGWDSKTLHALSPDDGKLLWKAPIADGCTSNEVSGDGDLVVAEVVCEKKRYLEAFDLTSGKSRWQRPVPISGEDTHGSLSVRGGAALLRDGDRLAVVNEAGDFVFNEELRGLEDVRFTASPETAVVSYRDQSLVDTTTAVDLRQAKVLWSKQLALGSLLLSGDKLYSLASLPEPLAPAGLFEIELATGQLAVTPTHLTSAAYDSLVAIHGGVVTTYYWARTRPTNTSHLEGHRLDPLAGAVGVAGGAPAESWPDSCALLQPAEAGEGYKTRPEQITVAEVMLPARCILQPPSVTLPAVTVGIAWAGADEEQAKQVMARIKQQTEVTPVAGLGHEALKAEVFGSPKYRTDVYFRVGARIGKVSVVGDSALALKLAKIAATRLG